MDLALNFSEIEPIVKLFKFSVFLDKNTLTFSSLGAKLCNSTSSVIKQTTNLVVYFLSLKMFAWLTECKCTGSALLLFKF